MTSTSSKTRSDWLLAPNLLTLTRFIAAGALPILFWTLDLATAQAVALGLFIYASATDFFDGWLARRLNQTSALGEAMDTLADKALLLAALAALAATELSGALWFWIGGGTIAFREIGVTLLRRWRRGSSALAVTFAAKWKTTAQMSAVALLLSIGVVERLFGAALAEEARGVGVGLFVVAVALTVLTGLDYLRSALLAGEPR